MKLETISKKQSLTGHTAHISFVFNKNVKAYL